MKLICYFILCLSFSVSVFGDSTEPQKGPVGWHGPSSTDNGIESGIDQKVSHSGKGSGYVKSVNPDGFGTFLQSYDASKYKGKRIKLSAYLKTQDVKDWSGMWMRIDGTRPALSFDNMKDRPLNGTKDWTQYQIILDVPQESINITFGILIKGSGTIWIDDVSFEETGEASAAPSQVMIQGDVTANGQPVKGAVVAAVQAMSEDAEKVVITNADGSFALKDLRPGKYWISATGKGYQASQVGPFEITKQKSDVKVELKKGGLLISGLVQTEDNTPLSEIFIGAYRYSDDQADSFFTRTDKNGEYSILLPEGFKYGFALYSEIYQAEWKTVELKKAQTLNLIASSVNKPPAPQAVLNWIQKNAVHLSTVQAGNGFEDMQPLQKVIGDARVVSLGEATHGTKEFFQLKHRMLEFLVFEMGFNVFGIEANYPEGYEVNKYVLTGEGDPAKALAGLYFWTWNTEEVLEMIRWMRQYNVTHERKVKFYGFDMQYPANAVKFVSNYMNRVAGKETEEIRKNLETLSAKKPSSQFSAEEKEVAAKNVQKVIEWFDKNKTAFAAESSAEEWDVARQHARVIQQYLEMIESKKEAVYSVRDASMAENIGWILDHEGPETKMVAWAHNGHVSFNEDKDRGGAMGSYLRKSLSKDLIVFGFSFNQGSFQAIEISSKNLIPITVGSAPTGSLDETLARANLKIAGLDLRGIEGDSDAKRWFDQKHITRTIGALYDASSDKSCYFDSAVTEHYDALLFVEKTTSAQPVRKDSAPMIFASEPSNLDFESPNVH